MSANPVGTIDVLIPLLNAAHEEGAPPTLMRFNFNGAQSGDFQKVRDTFPGASEEDVHAALKAANAQGYLEAPVMGAPDIFNLTAKGHKEALVRHIALGDQEVRAVIVKPGEEKEPLAPLRFFYGMLAALCAGAALWAILTENGLL